VSSNLDDNLPEVLRTLRTQPLFVMRLNVRKLQIVGATPDGYCRIAVLKSANSRYSFGSTSDMGLLDASPPAPLGLVAAGAALLLLIGLWTPVAGLLVAAAELGLAWSHPAEPWTFVHFGTLGAALAMLGPGAWSVDARLFGRKHIQIPQQ
jgi:hypothetical protein